MDKRQFLRSIGFFVFSWGELVRLRALAQGQNTQAQPESEFSLEVNVDLVVLNVSVVDDRGTNIIALSREDFEVYEDDIAQERIR